MATTLGVKLDDAARERIRIAAQKLDRTPHWLIKQAIFHYIDHLERGATPPEYDSNGAAIDDESMESAADLPQPFMDLALSAQPQTELRAAITAATSRPEDECVPYLVGLAKQGPERAKATQDRARHLVEALRAKGHGSGRDGIVQGLLHEFELSSQEGVALMCLAEALLRIPDKATRDALIRDKIGRGDWGSHLGNSGSLFVNAAAWGLLITGKLVSTQSESGLSSSLTRIIGKSGEPLVRKGVDMAMRLMGEQFVTGETIGAALANAKTREAKGFRFSYDMLGEAALTLDDAERYFRSYEQAIHAIGRAAAGRGIYEGPGISVKLSALHPRYSRAQRERVMLELYPRLAALTKLARLYDMGISLDAEEGDRLDLSLDLLERLCEEPELAGWNGIGFVIQAYLKRAPFVVDAVIDLARRTHRRLMVRLVKGAYWDSEIKRAQIDGLEGYPVFTRKIYSDVSYLACAKKMLSVPDAVYPQFATHNAYTLAAVFELAGFNYYPGQYEFQCLHGMGEPLYEEVVGVEKLNRPCRIYAPVGSHETLLPYLVRRLLENGANTSFVNKIANEHVPVDELIADPVVEAEGISPLGAPHRAILLPRSLFGAGRVNSSGIDLANEQRLGSLSAGLLATTQQSFIAAPMLGSGERSGVATPVLNPADHRDRVGSVIEAGDGDVLEALTQAEAAVPIWQSTEPAERAAILVQTADLFESHRHTLMALAMREAGKTLPNALGEVREAVDFLRYYAAQIREHFHNGSHRPLGPVVCISPWNFPLAIFTGQIAAALAAGNVVLAKPAEQTPLIAAAAVRLFHDAGLPRAALQLLPGRGEVVGAALVADPRVCGVMFTGSTEVAHLLAKQLAGRLLPDGGAVPLIAETGGQNVMIVDSSALLEQVVTDAVQSAFDSAGQRCSALRVLCLQEEIADRVMEMLRGAMALLSIGQPDHLATDVGPVIDAEARTHLLAHIAAMKDAGFKVHQTSLPEQADYGCFVPPTVIEIPDMEALTQEMFGPVLHVLRYKRETLPALLDAIHATGYGLTLGLHTRIDETIGIVTTQARVGNIYVNRNIVGAVVGVQPFGGEGLSGTGPKAGGPLALSRLVASHAELPVLPGMAGLQAALQARGALAGLEDLCASLRKKASGLLAALAESATLSESLLQHVRALAAEPAVGRLISLPGPTGEADVYALLPRGRVLCLGNEPQRLLGQLIAALATGNRAVMREEAASRGAVEMLPAEVKAEIDWAAELDQIDAQAALFAGDADQFGEALKQIAQREGALIGCHIADVNGRYPLERLLAERVVSINTSAAGGNASLMMVG